MTTVTIERVFAIANAQNNVVAGKVDLHRDPVLGHPGHELG